MNEAERRQSLLRSERHSLIKLVSSRPEAGAFLDDLKHKSGLGDHSVAEALQAAMEQCLDVVVQTVRTSWGDDPLLDTKCIRIALYESDMVAATSETFSDGSCLIRVSDALLSLCRNFSDLNHLWLGRGKMGRVINLWKHGLRTAQGIDPMSTNPAVGAGIAAVRYYILHQRFWGISAILGSPNGRLDEAGESFAQLALLFIVAHEVGHFVLRHPSRMPAATGPDAEAAHSWEYAADAFALRCVADLAPGSKHCESVSLMAAHLALLAVSMAENSLYLRTPESHPPFSSRWAALAGSSERGTEASTAFAGIRRMVMAASDMGRRLEKSLWDSLPASRLQTDLHDPPYYTLIRGMDMALDHPEAEYQRLLNTFIADGAADLREGMRQIREGELVEGLHTWEVKRADLLADPNRPLTYNALLNAVVNSPVWRSATADYQDIDIRKRTTAMLCINQISEKFSGV